MFDKYAIRITRPNLALILALKPTVHVEVKENTDRFFLFTVDANIHTVTDQDIVEGIDLHIYEGTSSSIRVVLL